MVLAVMAIGAIGSAAWFTDQDTATATASAATLDMHISVPSTKTFTFTNMAPGTTEPLERFKIYNQGSTIPIQYRFDAVNTGGSLDLYNKLTVEVKQGNCVSGGDEMDPDHVVYSGLLKNMPLLYSMDPANAVVGGGIMGVNNTHCWGLTFGLHSSAGNDLQGDTTTFNVVVDATQVENTSWPFHTP
jgi:hypothetical protein